MDVKEWLETRCEFGPQLCISKRDLYRAYCLASAGLESLAPGLTQNRFGRLLRGCLPSIESYKSGSGYWIGIDLRLDEPV